MSQSSSPSYSTFAFDVPEPQDLAGEFVYNYFLADERLTTDSSSNMDSLARHNGEPARMVHLTFTPLSSITSIEDLTNRSAISRAQDIVDNFSSIVSEVGVQSERTTFVSVQDDELAAELQALIDAELLAQKADDRGLSPLEAVLKYNSITSDRINATEILETTDIESNSNVTYYDPATGEDITVQKQGGVSEYAIGGFYNKKFIYDIFQGSENIPFSPLWGTVDSLLEEASNIQEESIYTLDSNLASMADYEFSVNPISSETLSALGTYPNTIELCGYVIEKSIVHDDGTAELVNVITVTAMEVAEYKDYEVVYGNNYRYSIKTVFYLSTAVVAPTPSADLTFSTFLISSRGSPFIDVTCKETVPPSPPENIEFLLTQEQDLMMIWDLPYNAQEDIKRFQVFRRNALEDPYTIIKEIDFDDSDVQTERSEFIPEYSKKAVEGQALAKFFTDSDFEFDKEYYYALCSVDAHDLSSGYSSQFKVYYDRIEGKMDVQLIGFAGAPKAYPNFTLKETLIVDCIKDSGHRSMKIYFDPECLVLNGTSQNLPGESGTFRAQEEYLETSEDYSMYKLQIINLDWQQDQKIEIKLKRSPTLLTDIADLIPGN